MKKSLVLILVLAGLQLSTIRLSSQNIGIGTTMPVAPLDVIGKIRSTDLQLTAGAANGSILQSDASGNTSWTARSTVLSNEWHLTGNSGSVDGTNFIGTTDNVPFTIKMNNQRAGRIENTLANTFFGYQSGNANTSGFDNTAVGSHAMNSNDFGYKNTAIGSDALFSNTAGILNTAVGNKALFSNTQGTANVAIGYDALHDQSYNPGTIYYTYNVAVGYEALFKNQPTSTSNGRYNTGIGTAALYHNGTGSQNTAVGLEALFGNNYSNNNTASGFQSLKNNLGDNNTATGARSLVDNFIGFNNTANGYEALVDNYEGHNNTAIGYHALSSNTDGFHNTGVGVSALYNNATGDYNTALGSNAYFSTSTLNNTSCFGYNSGGIVNASNRIEIGNSSVSWIGGQMGWATYSDARIKDNISEDVPGLAFISKLRPVTYNLNIHKQNAMVYKDTNKDSADWASKYDIEKIKITGFLAQDVERAAQESGYDFSGVQKPATPDELYSLRYSDFVMPLVKAVQELSAKNDAQVAVIDQLTQRIEKLEALISTKDQ